MLEEVDDDVLCVILSFLSPPDIASCSVVSRRIHRRIQRLLRDDDAKLWLPMCDRRWGSCTSPKEWKCKRSIEYRGLFRVLSKWENLIGFWRGVAGGKGQKSQLLIFEWGSNSIQGFRIVQASKGSFQVRKIPFLWIGAASSGNEIFVMNPGGVSDETTVQEDCNCHFSSGESIDEKICSDGTESVFSKMDSEWDVADLTELGLVLVNLQFVGKNHINHIVIEELISCGKQVGKKKMSLAEAVASASFGFSNRIAEESGGSCDHQRYGESPPGSFPYEMYHFLTGKVTSPGSDRAVRKQRKKDKERAENRGGRRRMMFEPKHFVKVVDCCPTTAQPLQGLWKGLCKCQELDFVLVSYNEQGGLVCRQIGESSSRGWKAVTVSAEEQSSSSDETRVSGVLLAYNPDHETLSGKICIYDTGGGFGFGLSLTNFVIDFRLICADNNRLVDEVTRL